MPCKQSPASAWMIIVMCGLLLGGTVVAPAAAAQEEPEPALVVALHEDGSATVSLVHTFDLTSDAEHDGYLTLVDDEAAREDLLGRYRARLNAAADAAMDETGRDMAVTDTAIAFNRTTDNETGIVTLSVMWKNLAAQQDGQLVVAEPFTGDFDPGRSLEVHAPDGYSIAETSPTPAMQNDSMAIWDPETNYDEFRVVLEESSNDGADAAESPGQPGFGFMAGLLALLGGIVIARRGLDR